ncbi:hypothetical protein H0H93_015345 [Arthromyces matolae]|nr:hypothetical protein H0H93_015345 [Arthromyces matolae]
MDSIVEHIVGHLDLNLSAPLFVAIQGPQGSGKSYLSAQLKHILSQSPHSLNVALLSIDDLYLPHDGLLRLATQEPLNPLWAGRGQPGTHDTKIGVEIMKKLKSRAVDVELPSFDKSLFNGEGDRLPSGIIIDKPVDVVILEGWCVGFYPISTEELSARWNGVWREEAMKLHLPDLVSKFDLERVNESLRSYTELWSFFDLFIQIKPMPQLPYPSQYSIIYKWRTQQEHNMKAANGGRGMPDASVKAYVDGFLTIATSGQLKNRYIPGYVFFGDIPPSTATPAWLGKSLKLLIDDERRQLEVKTF